MSKVIQLTIFDAIEEQSPLKPFLCCLNWANWYYPRRFVLMPEMFRDDIFIRLIITISILEKIK